jgi:hypothetical protein
VVAVVEEAYQARAEGVAFMVAEGAAAPVLPPAPPARVEQVLKV